MGDRDALYRGDAGPPMYLMNVNFNVWILVIWNSILVTACRTASSTHTSARY